jgi:uncharacterized Zn finger protein
MKITCPHCAESMTTINRHNLLRTQDQRDFFKVTLVCRNCGSQGTAEIETRITALPPPTETTARACIN